MLVRRNEDEFYILIPQKIYLKISVYPSIGIDDIFIYNTAGKLSSLRN